MNCGFNYKNIPFEYISSPISSTTTALAVVCVCYVLNLNLNLNPTYSRQEAAEVLGNEYVSIREQIRKQEVVLFRSSSYSNSYKYKLPTRV